MKARELLQYEIWSKRTTRKLLIIVGIVLGVAIVGALGIYAVETRWLSPGERAAAKAAMTQIDAMQDFGSLSDEEFEARSKQAKAKVEAAAQAAITARDEYIAFATDEYLEFTKEDRDHIRMAILMWKRQLSSTDSGTEFGKRIELTGTELRTMTRLELHKILD